MKALLLQILSVVTLASFFLPFVIVLIKKLAKDPFFMSFAIYWAMSGIAGLINIIPSFSEHARQTIGAVYNMLDTPIVLGILYFTATSMMIKKFTSFAFIFYVSLELMGIIIKGVNYDALKYPLAIGLILALIALSWEVVRYMKQVEHNNRQNAKVLIYAAVLFEYASFIVIYIFDYFVPQLYNVQRDDIYLVYYISSIIGTFVAACGFITYKKYVRQEPVRNEININIL